MAKKNKVSLSEWKGDGRHAGPYLTKFFQDNPSFCLNTRFQNLVKINNNIILYKTKNNEIFVKEFLKILQSINIDKINITHYVNRFDRDDDTGCYEFSYTEEEPEEEFHKREIQHKEDKKQYYILEKEYHECCRKDMIIFLHENDQNQKRKEEKEYEYFLLLKKKFEDKENNNGS